MVIVSSGLPAPRPRHPSSLGCRFLGESGANESDNEFFEYLKALSPSALDLEIRSLSTLDHLNSFLTALIGRLKSHRDFEAVQAVMSVFLTVHGDVLISNVELRSKMEELREAQSKEAGRLSELVGYAMGTLGFLRSFG
jgi:U3 small nucleolar RNA-associated protein 21